MEIEAVSGQKHFKNMKNKYSERHLVIGKAQAWMNMLNDGMRPTKWLKTTAKGTKVNFDFIKTSEQYDEGIIELETFLNEINEEYSLGISISKK